MPVISYKLYAFQRPEGPMSEDDFFRLKSLSPEEFSEYRSAVFAERKRRFWEDQGLLAKVAFWGGPISIGALVLFRNELELVEMIAAFGVFAAMIAALKFIPSWLSFQSADASFRRWFQEMRDQVLVASSYENYLATQRR